MYVPYIKYKVHPKGSKNDRIQKKGIVIWMKVTSNTRILNESKKKWNSCETTVSQTPLKSIHAHWSEIACCTLSISSSHNPHAVIPIRRIDYHLISICRISPLSRYVHLCFVPISVCEGK